LILSFHSKRNLGFLDNFHPKGDAHPKAITFTLEVPDDFDSFNDLETFVNQEGRKLKKELCEKLVQDSATEDLSSCPKCGHHESIAKGQKPRKLKTIFGDVEVNRSRRQCKECKSYFFPIGHGFLAKGMSRPN